jgi:four helix bundle protein
MSVQSFESLIVWQKAIDLVTAVYQYSQGFPADERFGLTAQMRRAAVSVPSNIAEGQERMSRGEFLHFLGNARGSLFELRTQATIAARLKFLHDGDHGVLREHANEVGRLLNGLINSLSTGHQQLTTSH